jgi:hypothetical protein
MPLTTFEFEELPLLPAIDGYEADALISGVATIGYSRERNWSIQDVQISYSKVVNDDTRPPGERRVLLSRAFPPPPSLLPHLISRLSQPDWRRHIQEHVDRVVNDDNNDAKIEASMRSMEP